MLSQNKGFILSKRLITKNNNSIVELWLSTDDGPVCFYSEPQQPVCFVLADYANQLLDIIKEQHLAVQVEASSLKTLLQQPVSILRSRNDSTHHKLRRLASEQGIETFESDVKLTDRFLMERFVYGALEYTGKALPAPVKKVEGKVKPSQYLPSLSSVSIDIECDEEENLFSIAIANDQIKYVIIRNTSNLSNKVDYQLFTTPDERSLLIEFCRAIQKIDPDLILGWNVKQFDFAVLKRRATTLGVKLNLGRNNSELQVREWEQGQVIVDLPGRCVIDGIDALKTMTYQFERFSLDFVSNALLNKGKLIDDTEDKLGTIKRLFREDPIALANYNLEDCILVNEIAKHTKFVDFLILRAKLTGLDMSRPGGSVAAFLNVYLPKMHRGGYISGNRPESGGLASPGGYVMSSKPGLYDNVLVLDFKSLYPSIIRTFKIDPLGLAEGLLAPQDAIEGFKGAMFSKEKHFLPEIITSLWKQRDEAKKAQDAPRSQAIKILMNSFYGVLGSGGCPLYNPQLASSITMRGHEIMQTTALWIKEAGYDVIYGDTDSTFVHIQNASETNQATTIGKQLEKLINKRWKTKLADEFQLENHLEIEFETHYRKFFMPTIRGAEIGSKKRYAGLTGEHGSSQIVFKGLENVRSDWTLLAKDFQEQIFTKIFADEPVKHYITETLQTLRKGLLDEKLVYSRRLRKPLSHYTKTMPPHVKAAYYGDRINAEMGRKLQYQNKCTVRYIMTTHGPQTVEHRQHPIDYEHYIEKQLQPIAESILPQINLSFEELDNHQLQLFG